MKALDIETIPNEAMIDLLPEPEVAIGSLKDPEKIQAKIDEAKKNQKEKMGLNPMTGRICSFSFYGDREDERFYKVVPEVSDAAEIDLLNQLLEHLIVYSNDIIATTIVTWNGMQFDFPYIFKRAALLRVEIPAGVRGLSFWTKKYSIYPHCDLLQVWNGWSTSNPSAGSAKLDWIGKVFLGSGKTERNYLEYLDLIKSGNCDQIGRDNLCDTKITYDLYKVLEPYLF